MACFTSLPYRNKFYPLLITVSAAAGITPITFGCFDAASDASRLYQFYLAFATIGEVTIVSENCFVQKTEDQQLFLTNEAVAAALPPVG
jgi:hypothetical protein